jgi:glycosidase
VEPRGRRRVRVDPPVLADRGGVDGFRIDVAHGLYKPFDLTPSVRGDRPPHPMWDQPEVHEVYRAGTRCSAEYDGDRMRSPRPGPVTRVDGPLHPRRRAAADVQLRLADGAWSAAAFRRVHRDTFDALGRVDGTPTWVLSNHDVVARDHRYGGGATGLARARRPRSTMMALPGSAYVYQGEELGLEQVDVPPSDRQDPAWFRRRRARARRLPGARAVVRHQRRRSGSARARGSRGCRCRLTGRPRRSRRRTRTTRPRWRSSGGCSAAPGGDRGPRRGGRALDSAPAPWPSGATPWSAWSTAARAPDGCRPRPASCCSSSGADPAGWRIEPDTAAWFRHP